MITRIGAWIGRHRIWSAIIGVAVALLLYIVFRPTPPTYEYVSEVVDRGEVLRKVSASGKLRALNTIKVGTEVSGQVTNVYVDYNSLVTAGQVLAEIDPTRVRARVQQVQAQVAVARASLEQAQAAVARAGTDVEIQQREYGRRQELLKSGFVSKAGIDVSLGQLAAARASLSSGRAQVQSAQAQIQQSSAELASVQLDLRRTVIVAPAAGVIINKLVEPGTTVAASFQTPNLFEIAADITRMQVEASVDEADIGQIRDGQRVRFTVDSYPGEFFAAQVRQVRKAATEVQNVVTYLVILDVDNLGGKLLPGMTANVEIITGAKTNVLRVPTNALRFRPRAADRDAKAVDNDKPTVFLAAIAKAKPEPRRVTPGLQGDDFTEITRGVEAGDRVLVRSRSLIKKPDSEDEAEDDNATS